MPIRIDRKLKRGVQSYDDRSSLLSLIIQIRFKQNLVFRIQMKIKCFKKKWEEYMYYYLYYAQNFEWHRAVVNGGFRSRAIIRVQCVFLVAFGSK